MRTTYCTGFIRLKLWAVTNDILDIFPASPFHVAIYLSSLVQTSRIGIPVTIAFYSLHWDHTVVEKKSPTDSLIAKNVLEGAKRRLTKSITSELLVELYHSVFKENSLILSVFSVLQQFCVFPSYNILRQIILFSNLVIYLSTTKKKSILFS